MAELVAEGYPRDALIGGLEGFARVQSFLAICTKLRWPREKVERNWPRGLDPDAKVLLCYDVAVLLCYCGICYCATLLLCHFVIPRVYCVYHVTVLLVYFVHLCPISPAKDKLEWTSLMYAALYDDGDQAEKLLWLGANVNASRNRYDLSALYCTVLLSTTYSTPFLFVLCLGLTSQHCCGRTGIDLSSSSMPLRRREIRSRVKIRKGISDLKIHRPRVQTKP